LVLADIQVPELAEELFGLEMDAAVPDRLVSDGLEHQGIDPVQPRNVS
jgi:hypothetical protein